MIWLGLLLVATILYYVISNLLFMKKDLSKISRIKLYKSTVSTQWILLLFIGVLWIIQDFEMKDWYTHSSPLLGNNSDFITGIVAGIIVGLFMLIILSTILNRQGKPPITVGNIDFLLPQTGTERIWFTFVAVTAGICEELIFRGALTYFLLALPFDLSLWAVGIIASLVFGILHIYQGISGVIGTTVLGAVFFVLFVTTGSLVLPILLHFIIDVKFIFMPNSQKVGSPD